MNKRTITAILLILAAAMLAGLVIVRWPKRLDVYPQAGAPTGTRCNGGRAGSHRVLLNVIPELPKDHGSAVIRVVVDGRIAGHIHTLYNYDFFSNKPAGTYYQWWVDGDWQLDVIMATSHSPPKRYFVSSIDGRAYEYNK